MSTVFDTETQFVISVNLEYKRFTTNHRVIHLMWHIGWSNQTPYSANNHSQTYKIHSKPVANAIHDCALIVTAHVSHINTHTHTRKYCAAIPLRLGLSHTLSPRCFDERRWSSSYDGVCLYTRTYMRANGVLLITSVVRIGAHGVCVRTRLSLQQSRPRWARSATRRALIA